MKVKKEIESRLSDLEGLSVKEIGSSYEVKWSRSFGVLIHKESPAEHACIQYEANPYNPVEVRVAWPDLKSWLLKNVY